MKKVTISKIVIIAILIWIAGTRLYNIPLDPFLHDNTLPDEYRFYIIGKNLAESGQYAFSSGIEDGSLSVPHAFFGGPMAPFSIASAFILFGTGITQARVLNVFLSLLLVGVVFLIGKELYGKRVGIASAAMFGMHPVVVFYSRTATHDMLFLLFMSLAAYLTISKGFTKSYHMPLLAGVCVALSALSKYNGLLAIVVLGAYLLYAKRKEAVRPVILMAVSCAAVMLAFVASVWAQGEAVFGYFLRTTTQLAVVSGGTNISHFFGSFKSMLLYYPFVTAFGVLGLALYFYRRRYTKPDGTAMLVIWALLFFLWWVQSSTTGKYALVFIIPLIIIGTSFFKDRFSGNLRLPLAAIAIIWVSSYLVLGAIAVSDFRNDAAATIGSRMYNMGVVYHFEDELAFFSNKPVFPEFWPNSSSPSINYYSGSEMIYSESPEAAHIFIEKNRPDYIILTMRSRRINSDTPRGELVFFADKYGILVEKLCPYEVYRIDWDSPRHDFSFEERNQAPQRPVEDTCKEEIESSLDVMSVLNRIFKPY